MGKGDGQATYLVDNQPQDVKGQLEQGQSTGAPRDGTPFLLFAFEQLAQGHGGFFCGIWRELAVGLGGWALLVGCRWWYDIGRV